MYNGFWVFLSLKGFSGFSPSFNLGVVMSELYLSLVVGVDHLFIFQGWTNSCCRYPASLLLLIYFSSGHSFLVFLFLSIGSFSFDLALIWPWLDLLRLKMWMVLYFWVGDHHLSDHLSQIALAPRLSSPHRSAGPPRSPPCILNWSANKACNSNWPKKKYINIFFPARIWTPHL